MLTLTNTGSIPLHKLMVRISHPAFVIMCKPHNSEQDKQQIGMQCYDYNWQEGLIPLGITVYIRYVPYNFPGARVYIDMYVAVVLVCCIAWWW